jgi:tetratricopeptide (TPR) repeat protein
VYADRARRAAGHADRARRPRRADRGGPTAAGRPAAPTAREAGERSADDELAAWGHLTVGRAAADWGDYDPAQHHFEQALATYQRLGRAEDAALSLNALGVMNELRGHEAAALAWYTQGLALIREHGLAPLEGLMLGNLGVVQALMGRTDDALTALQRSLHIVRSQGELFHVVVVSADLALVHCLRDEPQEAELCATEAIVMAREIGDQYHEHEALLARSQAHLRARTVPAPPDQDLGSCVRRGRATGADLKRRGQAGSLTG